MQIREYLKEPFDYFDDRKSKWLYIINAIVFSHLFLIIFQPYGISEEMSNPVNSTLHKFLFFFSIAVSTFLALTASQFIFRQTLGFQKVRIKKYTFWLLFEALILLLINFGMSFIIPDLGNDFEKELNVWFQIKMYPKLLLILIFPFFGTVIYIAVKRLQTEVKELDQQLLTFKYKYDITKQKDTLNLRDENNQVDVTLPINEILFVESSNQYVVVNYLKNNRIKKHIVRNRLKHILSQTKNLPIKQCHRSFAINLIHVKHLIRSNGKSFLVLNTSFEDKKIPVSNSFLETIKKDLDN